MTAPASTVPSPGHRAEDFRVDGQGQVQIGDRHYYGSEWTVLAIWFAINGLGSSALVFQGEGQDLRGCSRNSICNGLQDWSFHIIYSSYYSIWF